MKTLLTALIITLTAVSSIQAHCGTCSADGEKAHTESEKCSDTQLSIYFEVQSGLAADDLSSAQKAAAKLLAIAEEHGCSLGGDSCCSVELEAASTIAEAKDIKAARVAFKDWSDTLITKVEENGVGEGTAYKMFCPMAFNNTGASWLQAEDDLLNPYYGSMMLRCGVTQKTYGAASADAHHGHDHSSHGHSH